VNFVFYDVFSALCNARGVSPKRAALEIGLSNSIAAKWKRTGAIPNGDTLNRIADYFGVSVDYLLGTEKEKAPGDEPEADDEMARLLEEVRDRPDLRALFSLSKNATPDDVRKMMKIIKTLRGDEENE
jgi:transcriptional regulator with XRE-family HTH domain